jgi:pyridoxal phosphate enzyme (YggS family)
VGTTAAIVRKQVDKPVNTIEQNIQRVKEQIARSAQDCGRPSDSVTLIAVSKTYSAEIISQAISAGLERFGENRIQEAEPKILSLRHFSHIEWHMIGHLQSNKAKRAAESFDRVHSLDSVKLAVRLNEACADLGKTLSVLLQVDLGEEETKFGAVRSQVRDIVAEVANLKWLKLDGLMTIPPFFDDPELTRPYFSELRGLSESLEQEQPGCLGKRHLSMGMSNDFHVAIQEGSTMVRIGTAIFGVRSHA